MASITLSRITGNNESRGFPDKDPRISSNAGSWYGRKIFLLEGKRIHFLAMIGLVVALILFSSPTEVFAYPNKGHLEKCETDLVLFKEKTCYKEAERFTKAAYLLKEAECKIASLLFDASNLEEAGQLELAAFFINTVDVALEEQTKPNLLEGSPEKIETVLEQRKAKFSLDLQDPELAEILSNAQSGHGPVWGDSDRIAFKEQRKQRYLNAAAVYVNFYKIHTLLFKAASLEIEELGNKAEAFKEKADITANNFLQEAEKLKEKRRVTREQVEASNPFFRVCFC